MSSFRSSAYFLPVFDSASVPPISYQDEGKWKFLFGKLSRAVLTMTYKGNPQRTGRRQTPDCIHGEEPRTKPLHSVSTTGPHLLHQPEDPGYLNLGCMEALYSFRKAFVLPMEMKHAGGTGEWRTSLESRSLMWTQTAAGPWTRVFSMSTRLGKSRMSWGSSLILSAGLEPLLDSVRKSEKAWGSVFHSSYETRYICHLKIFFGVCVCVGGLLACMSVHYVHVVSTEPRQCQISWNWRYKWLLSVT